MNPALIYVVLKPTYNTGTVTQIKIYQYMRMYVCMCICMCIRLVAFTY